MKKEEWNQGLNHMDPALVEEHVAMREKLAAAKRPLGAWIRLGAIAACACLLVGAIVALPLLREEPPQGPPAALPAEPPTEQLNIDTAPPQDPTTEEEPMDTETAPDTEETVRPVETEPAKVTERETEPTVEPGTEPETEPGPPAPAFRPQMPTSSPLYYGNENAEGSSGGSYSVPSYGITVTARVVEVLEDRYTVFGDWEQYEFRLLRMQTVKLLGGAYMTDEFYYMIPADCTADFTAYHRFVLVDMEQVGYNYSVIYNKTQNCAEQLDRLVFSPFGGVPTRLPLDIIPFDEQGNLDLSLWNSLPYELSGYDTYFREDYEQLGYYTIQDPDFSAQFTLKKVETDMEKRWENYKAFVRELINISDEAADFIESCRSFEKGLYVPEHMTSKMNMSPTVQLTLIRYINGFPTNERVRISGGKYRIDKDVPLEYRSITYTKAQFTKEEEASAPNLAPAIQAISEAYDAGEILLPHIQHLKELEFKNHGIFGWYAKTDNGVIGVIRVTEYYRLRNSGEITGEYRPEIYDDAYFILESGKDTCEPISRDDLLARIGDYETTYIFTGEYDEFGKVLQPQPMY